MKKWATKIKIMTLAASVAATGIFAPATSALSSNPSVFISGDNTFYAFVQTGERVNVSVLNSGLQDANVKKQPVAVTVEAPGNPKKTCDIAADVPNGAGCGFSQLIASKAGIWKFSFSLPADAQSSKIIPAQHLGANLFRWDITIFDNGGIKSGRVWSEQYTIRQPDSGSYAADMTLYYQSEDGYLYRALYKGYNGQQSTLSADAFGIVKKDSCEPAYKSIDISDEDYELSSGKCGGSYKIFFEPPSDDLPATATKWDGTVNWVRPSVDKPEVSGLKFTPSDAVDLQSGTISFKLKKFIGQYEVKIDPTGQGNYEGTKVVTKVGHIKELNDPGDQLIKFDGLDKDGDKIPKDQPIKIKIQITKGAEIHLVSTNLFGRPGGIALTRLSGENAPSSNVCWDDTDLDISQRAGDSSIEIDGKTCPDSLEGVHKWQYNATPTKSWGSHRYIDDWTYASAKVRGTAEVSYVAEQSLQDQVIKRGAGIGVLIGGLLFIIAIIVGIVVWMKRRRKNGGDNNLQPPTQFPPTPPAQPPSQTPPSAF